MSIDITNKVWLRGPQDAKQRLLLMAIADHANDKGAAYPGVELLAEKSCQSVRNALRGILKLEVEGWIHVLRRRHGERSRGNEYLINLARLDGEKTARKPAETGLLPRHDKVACDDSACVENAEACQPRSDTVSCGEMAAALGLDEVTESRHEVTKRASRGDKIDPRIENRKEPSEEPIHPPTPLRGGQAAETPDPDGKQRGLWIVTNRCRAREGKSPLAWEAWVLLAREARQWPEPMANPAPPPQRRVRPSREARALTGVFRGG